MQARFGGAERDPQGGRRLRQRQPQEIVEDDDRTRAGVETPEGVIDKLAIGDTEGDVAGRRSAERGELHLERPAPPATQHVDAGADEKSVDPSVEPVGVAQPRQVPPGSEQGFLDRVPRELAIPEDEPGSRVQPRDSRAGKHREGVMIAPLRLLDETSLVHLRLSSSAAFRCAQMVCRADPRKGSHSLAAVRAQDPDKYE